MYMWISLHLSGIKRRTGQTPKKHGVTFEEAKTVFYDEHAIQFYDHDHSEDEDLFLLLGKSFISKTLVVCHYL